MVESSRIPAGAVNVDDFERLAATKLDPGVLGYFAGGAADEQTLRDNVAAFGRWRLRPRVAVDVARVSTGTTVLGFDLESPVLVAPTAFQGLLDPEGERAMARAAAAAGAGLCLSTLSSTHPGEVASAAPGCRRWFQLYCFRDRAITQALMEEAIASGYEAIVVTVDAPRAGRRERDLHTGFTVPPEIETPALKAAVGDVALDIGQVFELVDPSITWDDLAGLAQQCDLPVLVKGVMTAEDAVLAAEHGLAGVVVSNHGGRQLDRVPATVDVLGEVVKAVEGRCPVLLDGGIRRGTDIAVALALGAAAVMVGRPALWGLAVAGSAGAERVLTLLREEFELALTLLGCTAPADLTGAHLYRGSK